MTKLELEGIFLTALHKLALKNTIESKDTIGITDLTTCITKSYFTKKHGYTWDTKTNLKVLIGQAIHNILIPELAELANGTPEPIKHFEYEGVKIAAVPDIVTDRYIIELKTCNIIPDKPYTSHVEQTNAYMHIFDKPIGKIIYISRTKYDFRIYTILQDHKMFINTMQKAIILDHALKNDKLPKPCIDKSHLKRYCKKCIFKRNCPHKV